MGEDREAHGGAIVASAAMPPTPPTWHALDAAAACAELGVDPSRGLDPAEAARRLGRDGPNALPALRPPPRWRTLLGQFHAPLVYLLLVAAAVMFFLGDAVDGAVILGVVAINAGIGFVQERRAITAIDSLATAMGPVATVVRGGMRHRIDAAGLAAGDLVLLEGGDRVPADLRILRASEFRVDESTLTGESLPVAKRPDPLPEPTPLADRACLAYAGTLAVRGTAAGTVVATGARTELGRINELIAGADRLETPLTRKIASFSRLVLWLVLAVAAVTFVVGIARGETPATMFKVAVALAVGAIPEGLPAAITVMLAVGVSRMAARRAIIRKLPAVEALGGTTVICSDKTGTLTRNEMTVVSLWDGRRTVTVTGNGYEPAGTFESDGRRVDAAADPPLARLLAGTALCGDAELRPGDGIAGIEGDPTEGALVVAAAKAGPGFRRPALLAALPRVDEIPFDSERQWMATLHREAVGGHRVFVKGAVERVLERCPGAGAEAIVAAERMSGEGLRVLAIAECRWPDGRLDLARFDAAPLEFLGLAGMLDPPRDEAIAAIAACRGAGVAVKMVTGDHAVTAARIAARMRLAGDGAAPPALTGAELAAIPDAELPAVAARTAVFARMTPEQKLRLVRALQSTGHVVAMTGDGVNDAPALRQADIGVAMGLGGTEVAKDAADMVLADDNFATIAAAVEEGRGVFANLTRFVVWTLPTNGGEALVILASIAFGWTLPILPVQALSINMFTSVLLGMPLICERPDPDAMRRPPRDPGRPLLTFELFMRTGFVSLLLCVGALLLFRHELERGRGEAVARTAACSVIVAGEAFYLFSSRALLKPAWKVPLFSNLWLWAGIAAMALVQAAFVHLPIANRLFGSAPLDAESWVRVIAVGAAVLVAVEAEKGIRRALRQDAAEA
jgi:cation-transporting ATPase F